ncbi:MAG: hypothetical protein DHS20C21_00760 [Gemmatimonadota bacterium]|nr:MAG: hypothetical protein DHS20C21_00760 [Gemmatimonadota bacterium]
MLLRNTLGRFFRGRPFRREAMGALLLAFLAGFGPPGAAADPLSEALARLQSEDILVSDAAVAEIVAVGPPAVPALLGLLEDDRRDVRAGAIRGLGELGDPRAAAPLRGLLAESLDHAGPDDMAARYHRILLVQALGRLRDPGARELLLRVSRGADPFERTHAAISLFLSGADPGYDLVRASLEDPDPAIRCLAAEGVAESREGSVASLLLPRTRDESWLVRDTAFRELATHASEPGVREAYQSGASDPSWYVRQTVAEFAPD